MKQINKRTISDRIDEYKKSPSSFITMIIVILSAIITIGALVSLIGYILITGIPHLTPELFSFQYNSENVSMMPAIINTVIMIVLTLILSVPIGILSAVYLVEYAKRGNKLVKVVRITTETLQGIPSIVFGLFGFIFFVITLSIS